MRTKLAIFELKDRCGNKMRLAVYRLEDNSMDYQLENVRWGCALGLANVLTDVGVLPPWTFEGVVVHIGNVLRANANAEVTKCHRNHYVEEVPGTLYAEA